MTSSLRTLRLPKRERTDLIDLAGFPHSSRELSLIAKNYNDPNGYYDLFGITPWSTKEEIRKAYRVLARRCHPDGTDPDPEFFAMITQIYDALMNPVTKQEYDSTPKGSMYIGNIEMHDLRESLSAEELSEIMEERLDIPLYFSYYGIKQQNDFAQQWYVVFLAAYWANQITSEIKIHITDDSEFSFDDGIISIPSGILPNYFIAFRVASRLKSKPQLP